MYRDGTLPTTFPTSPASICLFLPLPAFSCLFLPLPASTCLYLPLPAFLCLPSSVYTKLVANKWNVQGRNITNHLCCLCLPLPAPACPCLPLPFSTCLCLPLPFSTCLCLSLPASAYLFLLNSTLTTDKQTHTHTDTLDFALLELLLRS